VGGATIYGENLLQELNGAGRFSEAKIKDLLLDLLPVLQFIHTGNVIHLKIFLILSL
jgi:serine/threonine protein kinase